MITCETYVITCETYVITCETYVITCEIHAITRKMHDITCEIHVIICETYVIECGVHVIACDFRTFGIFARERLIVVVHVLSHCRITEQYLTFQFCASPIFRCIFLARIRPLCLGSLISFTSGSASSKASSSISSSSLVPIPPSKLLALRM